MKQLLAGAAMRCIDPTPELLDAINADHGRYNYEGLGDPMYCRVTVLSDGQTHFCILCSDLSMCILTEEFLTEMETRFGIDRDHLIGGGTRSHQTVSYHSGPHYADYLPGAAAYYRFFHEKLLEAVAEALENLRPARLGAAVGESRINASREYPSPIGTLEAANHLAPAAPWLRVLKVESLEGEIISVIVNYSMHCCLLCWNDIAGEYRYTSGDVAGAVSRYVERCGQNRFPVGWTVGGGTDYEPLIYSLLERCEPDGAGNFHLVRNVMPLAATRMLLEHYAAEQGQDILRTLRSITTMTDRFSFVSAHTSRTLPSKAPLAERFASLVQDDSIARYIPGMDTTPENTEPPLQMEYRMARVCGVVFAGVNGAPYAELYRQLAAQEPEAVTFLFDDCFGSITNIPPADADEAGIFGHSTIQSRIRSSKEGAAAFLDAFCELRKQCKEDEK